MIVGLDFGTCFSSVALAQDGEVKRVRAPSTTGYSFPSSVLVGADGSRLYGQAAEDRRLADPEGYVPQLKRLLASREAVVRRGPIRCDADELVQALLGYLRDQAELTGGEPAENAVLTVPATYQDARSDRMRRLALGAGFKNVELVPEPVAAAMHYMAQPVTERRLTPGDVVLVYDLGGGTFDATLVRRTHRGGELVGIPTGLERLGGIDIDEAVRQRVAADFSARDPALAPLLDRKNHDPGALRLQASLAAACVRTKHVLSEAEEDDVVLTLGTDILSHSLTRRQLEELVTPLIEDTLTACRHLIDEAGLRQGELAGVLLVGGATRMPLVARMAQERLQLPLLRVDEPELAVCLGAARAGGARAQITAPAPLTALAVARSAPVIASGDVTGGVHVWNIEEGSPLATPPAQLGAVSAIALSADGEVVAIGGADGAIRLWAWDQPEAPRVIGWHGGWVNALTFAADRASVLSGGDDGILRASPLRAKGDARELRAHPAGVTALAVASDGGPVITGGVEGTISLWDLGAPKPLLGVLAAGAGVRAIAVSRDGLRLAAGTADGRVLVWDLDAADPTHSLCGHDGPTRALAFGVDGRLASGGMDGTLRLWDLPTGTCEVISAHEGGVRALAVRRDGLLLSAGADARICLWWPEQQRSRA